MVRCNKASLQISWIILIIMNCDKRDNWACSPRDWPGNSAMCVMKWNGEPIAWWCFWKDSHLCTASYTELNREYLSKCFGQMSQCCKELDLEKRETGVTFGWKMPHAASWRQAAGDLFQKCSALPLGDQLALRHFDYNEQKYFPPENRGSVGTDIELVHICSFFVQLCNACLMKTFTVLLIWWRWLWKWVHGGKFAYWGNSLNTHCSCWEYFEPRQLRH